MKRILLAVLLVVMTMGLTCKNAQTTAFQTISATETAVLAANQAYLDAVVTGVVKTNGVPTVESAFNDTQLALRTAAAAASGGLSAPVPAIALAKATAFTNTIVANSIK